MSSIRWLGVRFVSILSSIPKLDRTTITVRFEGFTVCLVRILVCVWCEFD